MRNVLVTGCGRGMALEVVRQHLEQGDCVYGFAHSITEELKEQCDRWSENLCVTVCELTLEDEVSQACAQIENDLDLVYNVAAIYQFDQQCGIEATSLDVCMRMYDVNSLGPIRVMRNVMRKLASGAIIMNVSSEAGSIGQAERTGNYGYCMSKAALNMASKLFSNELRKEGIEAKVICYHPGWLRTQMGGEKAMKSDRSISAKEAAARALKLTCHPENLTQDIIYVDYEENVLPW